MFINVWSMICYTISKLIRNKSLYQELQIHDPSGLCMLWWLKVVTNSLTLTSCEVEYMFLFLNLGKIIGLINRMWWAWHCASFQAQASENRQFHLPIPWNSTYLRNKVKRPWDYVKSKWEVPVKVVEYIAAALTTSYDHIKITIKL